MSEPKDVFPHLHSGWCSDAAYCAPWGQVWAGGHALWAFFLPVVKVFVELQQAVKSDFWGGRSTADTD